MKILFPHCIAVHRRHVGWGGIYLGNDRLGEDTVMPLGKWHHFLAQRLCNLRDELGRDARNFNFVSGSDSKAIFRYEMHTLPSEVQQSIGTSTLFAAWNASIYVNQIEDERLESVLTHGQYLQHTAEVLKQYRGLWFNDESFVVSRKQ